MAQKSPEEYLKVGDLSSDLGRRTVRGGAWATLGQTLKSLLEIASLLILARLLTPEDYGLVGMAVAVTGFLAMFKDMGLTMATVQRENITHAQVSALFWINAGLGILVTLAAAGSSFALAWFYDRPELVTITLVLAASFLFSGLTVQHEAVLRRRMAFGQLTLIQFLSLAISLSIAVYLALNGFGYWALVVETLVYSIANFVGVWLFCRWRPQLPAKAEGLRELLAFGFNLTGFSFVNYFARNLDDILIGRFHGAGDLGLYQQAYKIFRVPLTQINGPVSKVAVPALSRLASQKKRYRRAYMRILEKLLLITMPLGALLMGTSDWLVLSVLGDQWGEAAPILAVLGIAIFTQAIGNTTGWLFISQDRTRDMFRWGFIGAGTAIISFLIGLPWGAFGVALAYSVVGIFIRTPWLLYYVGRKGPVRTIDFYLCAWPAALAALGSGLALYLFRVFTPFELPLLNFLIAIPVAVFAALVVIIVLPRGRAILYDGWVLLSKLKGDKEEAVEEVAGTGGEDGRSY